MTDMPRIGEPVIASDGNAGSEQTSYEAWELEPDPEAEALEAEATAVSDGNAPAPEVDVATPEETPQGETGDERRYFGGLTPEEAGKRAAQARRDAARRLDGADELTQLRALHESLMKKAAKGDYSSYRAAREVRDDIEAYVSKMGNALARVGPEARAQLVVLSAHPDILARAVEEAHLREAQWRGVREENAV